MDLMMRLKVFFVTATILLLFCLGSGLYAQGVTRIIGQVTDKNTGEALPGANILITGTALGTSAGSDGQYVFLNMFPGIYDVKVMMIGYQPIVKTLVRVDLRRITTLDFQMQQTAIEMERVVVVAERDILHTEVSSSQMVISSITIAEAANVRSLSDLITKQAGVNRYNEIRGGSREQTGTIIEGIEYVDHRLGRSDLELPLSSVEQVAVQSGGFTAEQGNYRSGLINVALKKGKLDKYSGTLSVQKNNAGMKRFGPTMFGPDNYYNRQFATPEVAFIGTKAYYENLYPDDEVERSYHIQQQYKQFNGWISDAQRYNSRNPEEIQLTPLEIFLWHNWMTMTDPDWDRVKAQVEAHPEIVQIGSQSVEGRDYDDVITSDLKKAFANHANREADSFDFLIDGGFGGPVPFIDRLNGLANSTFYAAYRGQRQYYTVPAYYKYQLDHSGSLSFQTHIGKKLHLNMTNIYRYTRGLDQSGMDRTDFNLEDPTADYAAMMPVNNANRWMKFNKGKERRIYLNTWFHPMEVQVLANSLNLDYFINDLTYLTFKFSHTLNTSTMYPDYDRNKSEKVRFGPVRLDERPYGYKDSLIYDVSGWELTDIMDRLPQPMSVNNLFRYSSKNGDVVDNSRTRHIKLNLDFTSQVNFNNLLKTGVEFNYLDLNNDYFIYTGTRNEMAFDQAQDFKYHKKPIQIAAYIQDQLFYKGIVANLGLRMDYYRPGGKWFNVEDHIWNSTMFPQVNTTGLGYDQVELVDYMYENDDNIMWNYWNSVNDTLGNALTDVKNHLVFSPRIGISFPVTEKMKYYFNYGHFRQQPLYYRMFSLHASWTNGLTRMGNPNMEPARTIFYETGVEYNLWERMLLKVAGYMKDVTGQHGDFTYQSKPETGIAGIETYQNNHYMDIMGVEVNLQKYDGEWMTGWLNFDYSLSKEGHTGREIDFEDDNREILEGLYSGDEVRSLPRPQVSGNVTFHTPERLGLLVGDWHMSMFTTWRKGRYFTWNPANIPGENNNLNWPDYFMLDLKFSKRFKLKPITVEWFVNIDNPFNIRNLNIPNAFRAFASDEGTYLASLRLPVYDDPSYDALRVQNADLPANEWQYVAGKDKVGDLRSKEKPYINDPDLDLLYYLQARQIWTGITFIF